MNLPAPARSELARTAEHDLARTAPVADLERGHRYALAALLAPGKTVLDLGSGEGDGSEVLALVARTVIGMNAAPGAVAHARSRYDRPNLEFRVGSVTDIPVDAGSIDVVVCFDPVGPQDRVERVIEQIRRVLVPGGLLLVSTRDAREKAIATRRVDPDHDGTRLDEVLEAELRSRFAHVRSFGQWAASGSLVVPHENGSDRILDLTREEGRVRRSGLLGELALASDAPLPDMPASWYGARMEGTNTAPLSPRELAAPGESLIERDRRLPWLGADVESLQRGIAERNRRIATLVKDARERDQLLADTQRDLLASSAALNALREEVAQRDQVIADIVADRDVKLQAVGNELASLTRSKSWRATAWLRKLNRLRDVRLVKRRLHSRMRGLSGRHAPALAELVRNSPLFDSTYYLERNRDVEASGIDPALHYVLQGWKELRDPSAKFSTARYLAEHPDIAASELNPLVHYLRYGQAERRTYGPASASLVREQGTTVDVRRETNAKRGDTIDEEVRAIAASGMFDAPYYLAMNGDIDPPPADPIRHYCERGWREGRNPCEEFDTDFYLERYADVRASGVNPFYQFVITGKAEQRYSMPDPATPYENDIWFGESEPDVGLVAFYSSPAWDRLRAHRPLFQGRAVLRSPHESIGFYEPSDPDVLRRQALLAKRHGLLAFSFELPAAVGAGAGVHPLESFLAQPDISFRFCVHLRVAAPQRSQELAAAAAVACADPRYLRAGERPIVVVLAAPGSSDAERFTADFRDAVAKRLGVAPFVVMQSPVAPALASADAALDLAVAPVPGETGGFPPRNEGDVDIVPYGVVASQAVQRIRALQGAEAPALHTVVLGRAIPERGQARSLAYTRFHTSHYRRWLDAAIGAARAKVEPGQRLVFIDSWNAWSEGCALEPDRESGFARLNETTRALLGLASGLRLPKVSVLVPNYNHQPFLRQRLDSIYGQTYTNIEVILLDDCSSDDSRKVLDEYATRHPHITRRIYNESNSGTAFGQWARGIKAATGDLVWIAESDDYCDEHLLEALVPFFEDEAVLLAYARSVFVDRDGERLGYELEHYLSDLDCAGKWDAPYVETAHNEVSNALGIKNTIPNASGVVFKRPIDMPLLDDPAWRAMKVAGDWLFYLHVVRGGKIAYTNRAANYFRRYPGTAAERTYRAEVYYREVGAASRTVASLYDVPLLTLERCRQTYRRFYWQMVGRDEDEFWRWYDYASVLRARDQRTPNLMICTMGFYPGGAEILPIRLANELRRRGFSVLLFSSGLNPREDAVRRMLRGDVPLVETSSIEGVKTIIREYGIECLNTHQWYVQKYPVQVPDVFDGLRAHVASLHGMIEHGAAFKVTEQELCTVDAVVTTWVYTAEKNLAPFQALGLFQRNPSRFRKIPNGMEPPRVDPIPRADLGIPENAFVFCCVSRAIADKGWAETIEVVARARDLTGRDIRLVLVGNGPVYDQLCRSGTPDFVHVVGFSDDSVGHYAMADMGIMLTKFRSESFPLTIVDCLFAGKPFIASDVGDIRNMLTTERGVAGALVELQDWEIPVEAAAHVVAAFASGRERYAAAAAVAADAAARYRIDTVADQYVRLFREHYDCDPARIARVEDSPDQQRRSTIPARG